MRRERSPQIGRMAHLLKVAPEEVLGLDDVPDEDLRVLHRQIGHVLYGDGHESFARVAGLSKVLPGPVAGKLAEKFLPAELAARVTEQLDPDRARDLIDRVSLTYLADIALALDPVAARPIAQRMPARRIGQVAGELFARHEYAAVAEFVSAVTSEALQEAIGLATGHDLLAVVPLLDWNDDLDAAIAGLSADQVNRIVAELDSEELADLALALDPSRFGPVVRAVPVATLAAIARVLRDRGEHAALAGFLELLDPEVRAQLG